MSTSERLAAIVSTFEEMLFKRFDRLHAEEIHDTEVIQFLRAEGHKLLADRYIEWSGALDPDLQDNNTTLDPAVPDPGSAESYKEHPLNHPVDITTIEQLALLDNGVVLALKNGQAGQIRRDQYSHHLLFAGSDLYLPIRHEDGEGSFDSIGAAERKELAAYLPAIILGSAE